MSYAWIITKDFNPDPDAKPGTNCNAAGMVGPRSATDSQVQRLRSGEGHEFRMADDDGNIYYEGLFLGDPDSEQAFGPLDDFGAPNAGCVSIYYHGETGWEQL